MKKNLLKQCFIIFSKYYIYKTRMQRKFNLDGGVRRKKMATGEGWTMVITKQSTVDVAEEQLADLHSSFDKAGKLINKLNMFCLADKRQLAYFQENGASVSDFAALKAQAKQHLPQLNSIKNQFRALIEQVQDAEEIVGELNIQLQSYIKQEKTTNKQILTWGQRVNEIYDEIHELDMSVRLNRMYEDAFAECTNLYSEIANTKEIKVGVEDIIQGVEQLKKAEKEQLAQAEEELQQLGEPETPLEAAQVA
jgi:chromosome segregation ATPase